MTLQRVAPRGLTNRFTFPPSILPRLLALQQAYSAYLQTSGVGELFETMLASVLVKKPEASDYVCHHRKGYPGYR